MGSGFAWGATGLCENPNARETADLEILMIEVDSINEKVYRVTVQGDTVTTHEVTVDPSYRRRLGGAEIDGAKLVEKSFEFLLQREPNTQILRKFDLSVIQQYFPEYEAEIRDAL